MAAAAAAHNTLFSAIVARFSVKASIEHEFEVVSGNNPRKLPVPYSNCTRETPRAALATFLKNLFPISSLSTQADPTLMFKMGLISHLFLGRCPA
jgi:hypothetical protein